MASSQADYLVGEIIKARRAKLITLACISVACLTVFAYALNKLVGSLRVESIGLPRKLDEVDNQSDPAQDDVVVVDAEYDDTLDVGKKLKHGLNRAMNTFNRYNREAEAIAKKYDNKTMFAEVRRDMKVIDADHDDWDASLDNSKQQDVYFSTYNTLTNV